MKKYVFFDMDGVLTTDTTGSYTTTRYMSKKLNVNFEELYLYIKQFDLETDCGKITDEEIWKEIFEKNNCKFKMEDLEESFLSTPIDEKMIEIAKKLKEKYEIGIITDNSIVRANMIFDKHRFRNLFKTIIISEEVKSTKKGIEIFKIAADKANVKCEECIFIDNNPNNVKVANKAGYKGIYFDDAIRDYDKLLKEILV